MLSLVAVAQKKTFTLNDLLSGGDNYWNLQPKGLDAVWWGNCLVENDVEQCRLLVQDGKVLSEKEELFTLDRINRILGATERDKVRTLQRVTFPYPEKTQVLIKRQSEDVLIDWARGVVAWRGQKKRGEESADRASASGHSAFVRDGNLYVRTSGGEERQLSCDGSREIVYGKSVHREEWGIEKGTFWSPKGNCLAFYRMDQSKVSDYPQVDISHRIAACVPDKYPMAGEQSHNVQVGVYSVLTGKTVYLQPQNGENCYFTNISWSPDERSVYVKELNRAQNHAQLVRYDAATGRQEAMVYEERSDKYVEPMTPIVFLPWDSNLFITQSQRDGYNHLYLFTKDGKEVRQLTQGAFVVTEFLGFDVKGKKALFLSTEKSPLQHNLYSVEIATGRRKALDEGTGVHYVTLSPDGSYALDTYTSPQVARSVGFTCVKTGKTKNLLLAADPWDEYEVPEISCGTLKAADGKTDLYYRMVKPVGFDPAKKYPAVVYVYGGPHARNVMAARHWWARGWEIYMAQKGYLLFILDNRGSSERGMDFENVTFHHLGDVEMQDQMKGVDFLCSLPYVDADRLGVHGWSFGGFMTTNLMLTHPDVFKVGVAGGPVIDWRFYEVMYGERYMGTPQDNPSGYEAADLTRRADALKGRLQLIIGYNDPTCVPQHSLSFLRACEDAGTQPDFFLYPGDGHNMMGRDMVHLHERITRYFEDYLK